MSQALVRARGCIHTSYDVGKNVGEFAWPKGWRTKTVLAISKDRQAPTTLFDGQDIEQAYAQACQESDHVGVDSVGVCCDYDVGRSSTQNCGRFLV